MWTCFGLISYYVLLFVRLHSREVHVAGITPHPTEVWMEQVARNVTIGRHGVMRNSAGRTLLTTKEVPHCVKVANRGLESKTLSWRPALFNGQSFFWREPECFMILRAGLVDGA